MTCPSCGIPGAPADTCHQCNRDACDAFLHDGECALCVDIWREHDDQPPVGRAA